MTAAEFKRIRRELGLSQTALAQLFGLADDRSIRRWEKDCHPVPGTAAILMRLLHRGTATLEDLVSTL